jgi:hypothetical protein
VNESATQPHSTTFGTLARKGIAWLIVLAVAVLLVKVAVGIVIGLVQAVLVIGLVVALGFGVLWALRHL